jgi:nitrogen regulatory protein P-II 1
MKEIKALIRPPRLYQVIVAVRELAEAPGLTVSDVRGFPSSEEAPPRKKSGGIDLFDSFEMTKVECVVPDEKAELLVETIARAAHTGNSGDGKIFIYDVEDVVKIRTGERGKGAV